MNVASAPQRHGISPRRGFGVTTPRSVKKLSSDDGGGEASYDAAASADAYSEPPNAEMALDEFEESALARLKVLRKIEEMKTRNLPQDAFRAALDTSARTNLPTRQIDQNSHFILRAAYCRTEDLRRWFLAQECALFRHRLERLASSSAGSGDGNNALREFLIRNDFRFDRVNDREKERLRSCLLSIPGGPTNPIEYQRAEYCRVPFVQALELVSRRECHVERGYAYVPLSKVVSIVAAKFRASLSKSLALSAGVFNQVVHEEGARIGPLLRSMNSQYTGPGGPGGNEKDALGEDVLTAATVDDLAARNMPLCMSRSHNGLKQDHKLKHQGRLQYGLFLKGAGMSLEEHTLFFQKEFTRIMTPEQFEKGYGYSIRHMHGKEGKRASYTPYSCAKIIFGNPPQSSVEHHGCPYRHYDDSNLSALLTKMRIGNSSDRDSILRLKKENNFQLACLKHFEVTHPGAATAVDVDVEGVGNHPNAWFMASVSYGRAKSGTGGGNEGSKGAVKVEAEEGGSSSSE